MKVIVITEVDKTYDEETVIGVADSVNSAEKLINEYYGKYKEVQRTYIESFSIEYIKIIDVDYPKGVGQSCYMLTLEWFTLNEP